MPKQRRVMCTGNCGRVREIGPNFYLDVAGLPRPKCKFCMAKDATEWRNKNPDTHKACYQRANFRSNLRLRFGLSVEEYNILVAKNDGRCGICRKGETRTRRLSLDHDHKTGVIRGFLCSRCNLALGNAGDSTEWLLLATQYLRSDKILRTSDLEPPIPVLLYCPMCHTQHIDEGEFTTKRHTTHSCQNCGLTWRPAIVATVGVRFLPGFKNEPTV